MGKRKIGSAIHGRAKGTKGKESPFTSDKNGTHDMNIGGGGEKL